MRRPTVVRVTWPRVVAGASALLAAAAWALGVVGLVAGVPAAEIGWFVAGVVLSLPSLVLGGVIAWRRPHNAVGGLLASVGLSFALLSGTDTYQVAVSAGADLPRSDVLVSLSQGAWVFLYVPVALLALVFPDGRLLSARWRVVAWGLPLASVLLVLLVAMDPAPYLSPYEAAPHALGTYPEALRPLQFAMLPVLMGLFVACAVSVALRFRRASGVARAQLSWFVLAAVTVPATLLLCWVSYLLLDRPDLVVVGLALIYLAVPFATAVAMLRHDLYDVDRALTTTVTYALVTGALLTVFTVVTALAGLALGRSSPIAAAGATAVCAVVLGPLLRRTRRRVDARLYPLRRRALTAVADLQRRTHADMARPEQLEEVLRRSLGDPALRVGYVAPGSLELVDAAGEPFPVVAGAVPVQLGGSRVGVLAPGRPLSRELAREVAEACALLVELGRLRLELSRALGEIEESRTRLVHAADAERRRLVQDLHDGSQQRLVTLGMSLRIAQRHLADGGVDVDALLDQSVAELGAAVAELRQLAQGMRPSSLDDGLGPALASMTASLPVLVDLDLPAGLEAGDLPEDLCTTAYFVATEAVTNAVKHASAARIGVHVRRDDGTIEVRVVDDGDGGARQWAGSGLTGLTDRVRALGGSLLVDSPPGRGTTVRAVLPCAS